MPLPETRRPVSAVAPAGAWHDRNCQSAEAAGPNAASTVSPSAVVNRPVSEAAPSVLAQSETAGVPVTAVCGTASVACPL